MWIVRYRAPELLDPANAKRKDCSYTDAVDTWSWGCVLYEMLSGQLYMAEKDLEHSHLHIAASHEHQKKFRGFGMCTTHVYQIAGNGVARTRRKLRISCWR